MQIPLREYEATSCLLAEADLRALMSVAGSRLSFRPSAIPGEIEIRATSHVGTLVTPGIEVLIRPKVGVANLLYLLEADAKALETAPELVGLESQAELVPVMATLLVTLAERATARGLYHGYQEYTEPLIALRGRVHVPTQVRAAGIEPPVSCRFEEFTADVIENRALKCALRRVARMAGVPVTTRRRAAQVLMRLEEAADAEVMAETIDRITYTRLNRHYEPVLRLAAIVLRWSSINDQFGGATTSSFLVDMNRVFEDFVLHRLRRLLARDATVSGQLVTHLDIHGHVPMRPDLTFRQRGILRYVADTKYKLTSEGRGRSGDYYQLLAYCTALGLDEGMLIYADDENNRPPREVVVSGTGVKLRTYRLGLDGSPATIEAALARLADDIRDRYTAMVAAT